MNYKYIEIKLIENKPKTQVYSILNKNNKYLLGIICWKSTWRKYCFFPNKDTVFDSKCLKDITEFLDKLMKERKKSK